MPETKKAKASEKELRSLLKQYRKSNDEGTLQKLASMMNMAPEELAVRLRYDFADNQLENLLRAAKRAKIKKKLRH